MKRREVIRSAATASLVTVVGASTAAALETDSSGGSDAAADADTDTECCGDICFRCTDTNKCPCCECSPGTLR